jgi:ABC-type branched-subunit amino acid transport system substrate-binding protein/tRNA A-37 threonylcarbamoyl transferase component Bud32
MKPEEADPVVTGPLPSQDAPFGDLSETLLGQHSTSTVTPAPAAGGVNAWVGKALGKYQVTGVLGAGGMGVVLKARDPLIERDVAVKVLAEHLAANASALARFLAEAKSAGKINHPNVVAIYEICPQEAMTYLVLEYVPGGSLEDLLGGGRTLPVAEATRALIDACKGVGAAHAVGLVHRDIKPANFMRGADGTIKVADFGLAKPADGSGREFTQAGTVVGTPLYMSPEQCEARPLDHRSDIYSLGATYYTLLTGKRPYDDTATVPQLMYAHCHHPAPDPRAVDPALPPACARVVGRAMAKAPADRYQSTAEMLADLQAVLGSLTAGGASVAHASATAQTATQPGLAHPGTLADRPSRRHFVLAAGGVAGGGALAAWLAWGGKSRPRGEGAGDPPAARPLTATAPGVTAADITLGMTGPFSGPAKELGRAMQIGIETYFDHLNETAGGVHGRKLKLLALDDGYEPARCAAAMREMLGARAAFAFVGNVGTATAEVALPLALQQRRVFFGAFTGAGLLRRDPPDRYAFNYRASYAEETAAIVQHLLAVRRIRPEEIAVFAQQDGYGDAGFAGVTRALRKAGFDSRHTLRVGYARNSMDLDAAAGALLERKDRIKAVVMVPTYRQAAALVKRVVDGGMRPVFTSVSFVDSNALAESLRELGPRYAEGVIVTQVVPFYGSGATGVLEYRERLGRYFPAEQPGFVSLEGYIVARALCAGLEKAGPELTTEALVDALEGIQGLDFGIGTKITFGPSEHQASHKVWAATLDAQGQFRNLELE